jgi:single-stranded DNA-binding protein
MFNHNHIRLSGFVTSFEVFESEGKKPFAKIVLTTKTGDRTLWHTVLCYGDQVSIVKEHIQKGRCLGLVGRIDYQKWQTPEGGNRLSTNIVAKSLSFVYEKDVDDKWTNKYIASSDEA